MWTASESGSKGLECLEKWNGFVSGGKWWGNGMWVRFEPTSETAGCKVIAQWGGAKNRISKSETNPI
jgi:hypothetical protein